MIPASFQLPLPVRRLASTGTLIGALACLLSPCVQANTFYVSPTGDDANSGAESSPFATIQRGVDAAMPGDTVSVADGVYGPAGHLTCGTECSQGGFAAPVTIWRSGTPSAPITIAAQNKWKAILDCGLPSGYAGDGTDGVNACDAFFLFEGRASWVTISGFDIQRAYWMGAVVNDHSHHISFVGNHFHHIGNRIYDVPVGTDGFGIVGVYAGPDASSISWDRNQFDHIGRLPHAGLFVWDDYTHDHALYVYNGPYTITNNVFFSQSAGWNIQTAPGVHDAAIINNTLVGGANPFQDGCIMLWGSNLGITIQNNIFFNGTNYAINTWESTQVATQVDHNIVYGSVLGLIEPPVSGSVIATGNYLGIDPLFVNSAINDYHLQPGSPAIDTGASVSLSVDFDGALRPFGPAFDIGAFEFTGASSSPVAGLVTAH